MKAKVHQVSIDGVTYLVEAQTKAGAIRDVTEVIRVRYAGAGRCGPGDRRTAISGGQARNPDHRVRPVRTRRGPGSTGLDRHPRDRGVRLRKRRRPGNRAPTLAEAARIVAAKEGPCMACVVWARAGHMPLSDVMLGGDYDHKKSGNVRRGHAFGFNGCLWHHRGHPGEGWSHAEMRAHFGPSLTDGSALFRRTYGSNDELIQLQTEINERGWHE